MNWIERFFLNVEEDKRYEDLRREHIQALIDVMALAMTIDRHIAIKEREAITALIKQLPDHMASEHMVNQGVRTAWDMLEADAPTRQIYYTHMAEQLEYRWLKLKAFEVATRIVAADDQIVPLESNMLITLAQALDIPQDEAEQLREQLALESISK